MPNIPAAGHWRLLYLPYFAATEGWSVQIAVGAVENSGLCWRKAHGAEWQPWEFAATATPPEEIPLKLAEGISVVASHPALFWKNQFGEVTVVVSASKATPFIDTEVIATLPEGFRPKYTMIFPCVASDTRDTGFLYMDRLGAIQVSFGSKSEKNVIACFSFVAAP